MLFVLRQDRLERPNRSQIFAVPSDDPHRVSPRRARSASATPLRFNSTAHHRTQSRFQGRSLSLLLPQLDAVSTQRLVLLSTLVVGSAEEVQSRYAASPLGPQEYESCDEAKSASPGMENAPPPNHAARFSRGTARRCVHQTAIDRHDHGDRVGPTCEQDRGAEQPTQVEGTEKRNDPEGPTNDGQTRLQHVAAVVGQLPLGEERAIVELKPRGLLGEVDVDRGSSE